MIWARERGKGRRASNDGTEPLLGELEQRFDLMRLRRLRAELEEEDGRLAGEEELLLLLDTDGPGTWWRRTLIRARLLWIGTRRKTLADRQRWFRVLEEDLEFALRLRRIRPRR